MGVRRRSIGSRSVSYRFGLHLLQGTDHGQRRNRLRRVHRRPSSRRGRRRADGDGGSFRIGPVRRLRRRRCDGARRRHSARHISSVEARQCRLGETRDGFEKSRSRLAHRFVHGVARTVDPVFGSNRNRHRSRRRRW